MTTFTVPTSPVNSTFTLDPTVAPGVNAPQYAFGIRLDDASIWFHFGVQPTEWLKIGSGAPSGTVLQIFEYVVTGAEPDPSEIDVTLPTAMADTSYGVVAQCQGCANIVAIDVPSASKTTTQFTMIATGDFTAADRILFMVGSLTA
jgi:hypothetical protein